MVWGGGAHLHTPARRPSVARILLEIGVQVELPERKRPEEVNIRVEPGVRNIVPEVDVGPVDEPGAKPPHQVLVAPQLERQLHPPLVPQPGDYRYGQYFNVVEDPVDGAIHIVWTWIPQGGSDAAVDLSYAVSRDGGATWTEVDGRNRPRTDDLEGFATAMHGGLLYMLHQVSEATYLHGFATSDAASEVDSWVIRDELGLTGQVGSNLDLKTAFAKGFFLAGLGGSIRYRPDGRQNSKDREEGRRAR